MATLQPRCPVCGTGFRPPQRLKCACGALTMKGLAAADQPAPERERTVDLHFIAD